MAPLILIPYDRNFRSSAQPTQLKRVVQFSAFRNRKTAAEVPSTHPRNILADLLLNITSFLGIRNVDKINESEKANVATLEQHVRALTPLNRSFENPAGLEQAANYIKKEWEALGFVVKEQPFTVKGRQYKNLMVSIGPESAERFIIGAHYDVCAYEDHSGKSGQDMPGADDNASGVASLLELSRLLKSRAKPLNKRIDFVAFTLEEPPNFATNNMGSAQHAKSVSSEKQNIKGMLALEMLGYFKDDKGSQKYPVPFLKWLYGDRGNFVSVIGNIPAWGWVQQVKHTMEKNSPLSVKPLNAPSLVPGVDFSDHRNYAKLGIPSAMITDTAFYRNPNYHQVTDTPETLDYDRMGKVVEGLLGTVINL